MPDSERAARRERLREDATPAQVESILVNSLANTRYLTGFTGSNALLLLLPGGDQVLLTDPRYTLQAAAEADCPIKIAKGYLPAEAVRILRRKKIRSLGFERNRLSFEVYEFLQSRLPGVKLVPLDGLVEKQRAVKSPEEIAHIRLAVLTNSQAFNDCLLQIQPGQTSELEVAAELEYRMKRLGAEEPAFETIVAAGERSALPHARPTARILKVNELLLIDMGASQAGYMSDMTRVVSLGRPPRESRRLHAAVLEAQLAAVASVRPGITAAHVDRVARGVLRKHQLDQAFLHSTGHGLGLEIHELPRVGRTDKTRLEEGMAITIEPGVYLEGVCGIRIEDTVVVTANGCEVLTPTPKELLEI